ncbi:non-ribosomal peptide synthetase [Streptomyces filamentosus]|uniref:non-ribosomal peptide synthetase n=1 Tax=Streptomyces filamentosus TaxID=67294 RepID=UPI00123B13E4|nr:non-ribosomal peptide synthetase [Streptomyces filamentosus]KAA6211574.1 amino acid adenylation domain-containing protein [Streptomyces filamentosus]
MTDLALHLDDDVARRLAALDPRRRDLALRMLAGEGAEEPPQERGIGPRPTGDGGLALSYEQERLWFMDRLVPFREVFHVPTALRLRGPLDPEALRRALQHTVRRHQSLRTVFTETPRGPVQTVLDRVEVPLVVDDLRGLPDARREAERRACDAVLEPFDLEHGPLLRVRLHRTAEEEWLLLIVQHHIVSDYWSLGILLGEIGALYAAELGGTPAPAAPDLHYPDFAHWQRETLTGENLRRELDFWKDALADAPEVLELPLDRPRTAERRTRGRFHPVRFAPALTRSVRDLAGAEGATLHQAFLAAYFAALSRHVRQDDIVVGVPVAGRSRPELQSMIGYFLNWLPIRVQFGDRPSFRELLRRVTHASNEAFAHQDLPFEMLVQALNTRRSPGSTPVFQTSFSLRDAPPVPPAIPGTEVEYADLGGGATHYDMMAELWVEDGTVTGYLPYNDELFDDSTLGSFFDRMHRLLEDAVRRPDTPVADLDLLGAGERARLLGTPAAPPAGTGTTLHERFTATAARHADRTAVTFEDERQDYATLERRSNRYAHALRALGAGPGRNVGVHLDRCADLPAVLLGVLKTGAAYVPVDADNPPERTAVQFADANCAAVVTTADLAARHPDPAPPALLLDGDGGEDPLAAFPDTPVPASGVDSGAPAYIIYTSGSTGVPKGVVVSHANALRLFTSAEEHFDFGPDDVWTMFHSHAFDFSVWELWGALLHGGRLVVVPHWVTRAADEFAALLADEGVTVLNQTPSSFAQVSRIVLERKPELALRYVVFGGEALEPTSLADWFAAYGDDAPRLVNMYGITETTVHVTHRRITAADAAATDSVIGDPLRDLALYVLDEDLHPVPPGVPGELFVGGAGVALGYLGRPDLTADRMLPDPFTAEPGARMYRSGDLARRLPGGELCYLGRADGQVKIRGHRIELGEIRSALLALPGVVDAVVVTQADATGSLRLVAYVVPAEGVETTGRELRRALGRGLPEWMVPTVYETLDAIPLTRNGKLDRRALPDPGAGPDARARVHVPPETDTEKALAEIWQELLRLPQVGLDDDFFHIGGHSLMVVQLVSRIRERLGREVPIAGLFQHPGLREMATEIDTGTDSREAGAGMAADSETALAGMSEAEIDAMLAALGDE